MSQETYDEILDISGRLDETDSVYGIHDRGQFLTL
jgi:hypothetical protein